jgi:DNA-binding transcriptional ArsR family regulator
MALHVRDMSPRRGLAVEIDCGAAYEALVGLIAFAGDEPEASYEVGKDWFRSARRQASRELVEGLRTLVGRTGWLMISFTTLIRSGPGRAMADLLGRLESAPAENVKQLLLEHALAEGEKGRDVRRLQAASATDVKRLSLLVLKRWQKEVFADQQDGLLPILETQALAWRREVDRVPPLHLIEQATNGIAYEAEPGISKVVLVPSVLTKPWVFITESGPEKVFFCPAPAGERSDRRVAALYAALGDPSRLRILRRLTQGEAGLTDLAEELGLAKSTVHGHTVLLRDAGFVRSLIGARKGYRLADPLPNLDETLAEYLGAASPAPTGGASPSRPRSPGRRRRGSR